MRKQDLGAYYNQVKKELDNKLDQADYILNSIQSKLNETENNREQSTKTISNLTENYQQATTLINQTKDELAKVADLRIKAFDPTTGIEATLNQLSTLESKANKASSKIEELRKDAMSTTQEVKEYLTESSELHSNIRNNEKSAQQLLEQLQDTYELAVNTGLAGSFDERKKSLEDSYVNKWQKRFVISMIFVGIIATFVMIFSFMNGFDITATSLFRLALVTPLVFYTGYAALQYSKERRLHEKYAFKAVVATSLESYTNLLVNKFGTQYSNDIVKFVISTMDSIYLEPHEEIKSRSFGFGTNTKLANFKAEIKEEIRQIIREETGNGTT